MKIKEEVSINSWLAVIVIINLGGGCLIESGNRLTIINQKQIITTNLLEGKIL